MHELSLSSAVVATVERHAGGCPVTLVSLRIGRLRQVVPESLAFYFGFVARGTVCEGAALEYELVPARIRCTACDCELELDSPVFVCTRCLSTAVEVVGGDEFEVDSIVVEEKEEACIGRT
jgi:hydrogenase nickel incorporation protein HypA/HybF